MPSAAPAGGVPFPRVPSAGRPQADGRSRGRGASAACPLSLARAPAAGGVANHSVLVTLGRRHPSHQVRGPPPQVRGAPTAPSLADAQRRRPPARLPAPRRDPFSHPRARVTGKCRAGTNAPQPCPLSEKGGDRIRTGLGGGWALRARNGNKRRGGGAGRPGSCEPGCGRVYPRRRSLRRMLLASRPRGA